MLDANFGRQNRQVAKRNQGVDFALVAIMLAENLAIVLGVAVPMAVNFSPSPIAELGNDV